MLKQIVAPTDEAIEAILSLDSVRKFASVIGTHDDDIFKDNIKASIADAEKITNRQLVPATYELTLSTLTKKIKLPKNPIQEVLKIEYMDKEGNYQILASSSYVFYEDLEIGTIIFENIPSIKQHPKAIKITFVCGYEANEFPAMIKQWLKVRVCTLYEHREGIVIGTISTVLTHVDSALEPFRIRPM